MNAEKKEKKPREHREHVRLDEIVKLLFEVSKDLLVKTLNALFHEDFDPDNVKVDKTETEYAKNDLEMIRADLFIKITEDKPNQFHIEIETVPNDKIAVRTFEYDIMNAISNWRLEGKSEDKPVLFMPKSLVIHIESGDVVPKDFHSVDLVFADGIKVKYTVPVMRYWEYDEKRLKQEKLYSLLPLRIFMLRDELERATKKGDEEEKLEAMLRAKNLTDGILNDIGKLYDDKEISHYDMDKMMLAAGELFKHLNKWYKVDEKLNEEVDDMVKTLIDPKVEKRGKRIQAVETAKIMLLKKEPMEKIIEYTGLDEEDYRQIILREQALLDYNSDMNASKREGIKEGIDKMIDAMRNSGMTNEAIEKILILSEQ